MARKSKYAEPTPKYESKWNAALYVRLSREDGDKTESDSVTNQRTMLEEFIMDADISVFDIYIDDGFTGTNFERPDFTRMMNDIKAKKVNCVIVKDLSRFGRNYIEVGNYIEQIFPFMGIRFISVNDVLDSYKNPAQVNNIIVPFKNLMNDEYARDISTKIRSSLKSKKRNGQFIGSFAPYGYKKAPNNRNKLIIDEEIAPVIKDIFTWFVEGLGKVTITKKLNERGILNPTEYKKFIGLKYSMPAADKYGKNKLWSASTVSRILTHQVYIGNLVQSQHKVQSYKVKKIVQTKEEEWDISYNTHEPIIDIDTWNKVQDLLNRDTRVSPTKGKLHLLAGFMKCEDCGRAMNKKNISQPYANYSYYVCSTYKKMGKNCCTKHTVRTDKVEKALLISIQKHIELAVDMEEIIRDITNSKSRVKTNNRLESDISNKKNELKKIKHLRRSIYEDWKSGDLTREEYHEYKIKYENSEDELNKFIEILEQERMKFDNQIDENNNWIKNLKKYQNINELNREILIELLEKILVGEKGELTFVFKFADEFKFLNEFIEQNKNIESTIYDKVDNL